MVFDLRTNTLFTQLYDVWVLYYTAGLVLGQQQNWTKQALKSVPPAMAVSVL